MLKVTIKTSIKIIHLVVDNIIVKVLKACTCLDEMIR